MDTKTLVVGQDVLIASGPYRESGKVVKITPEGVQVLTGGRVEQGVTVGAMLLHFDNDGRSYVPEPVPANPAYVPGSPWGCGNGTIEGGPWYITGKKGKL